MKELHKNLNQHMRRNVWLQTTIFNHPTISKSDADETEPQPEADMQGRKLHQEELELDMMNTTEFIVNTSVY